MAHQLSLFVENKPGKLNAIMEAIIGKNIDIKAFTIASADKFGIIKLLVNEPNKARELLKGLGFAVALADVMVIEIVDMPAGMQQLTSLFSREGINIDSAYAFTLQEGTKTLFIIETKEAARITELLAEGGYKVLSDARIYSL